MSPSEENETDIVSDIEGWSGLTPGDLVKIYAMKSRWLGIIHDPVVKGKEAEILNGESDLVGWRRDFDSWQNIYLHTAAVAEVMEGEVYPRQPVKFSTAAFTCIYLGIAIKIRDKMADGTEALRGVLNHTSASQIHEYSFLLTGADCNKIKKFKNHRKVFYHRVLFPGDVGIVFIEFEPPGGSGPASYRGPEDGIFNLSMTVVTDASF